MNETGAPSPRPWRRHTMFLIFLFTTGCLIPSRRPPVVIPVMGFMFWSPETLCRNRETRGHLFAVVITDAPRFELGLTGREPPVIPPGTIGVFTVEGYDAEDAMLVQVRMREVILHGRRLSVDDASAETSITNIGRSESQEANRATACLPAGSLFLGGFERTVTAE